jgi:hypothetical protein
MKDWKIRQEMYHRLNNDFKDNLDDKDVQVREGTIIEDCVDYIQKPKDLTGWMYPAKSYVVALCYATWLSEDFDEDFLGLLNDPDLLYGNDPYFVTYDDSKDMYDTIIERLGLPLPMTGVVPDIKNYYLDEFMLNKPK